MSILDSDIFARHLICFLIQVSIMYGSWAVKYFAQGVSGMIFDENLSRTVIESDPYRKLKIFLISVKLELVLWAHNQAKS